MKKIIIAFLVLVVSVIGAYYLVFNNSLVKKQTDTSYYPPVVVDKKVNESIPSVKTGNTPKAPEVVNVVIDIKNFSFVPSKATIKAGTKVTWVNNDNAPHTVSSDTFDSGILSPGGSFSFVFNDSGSINYHCSIHSSMKGEVVVVN